MIEVFKVTGLKLISKSLQISYDSQGYKYDLPVFIINQPDRFEIKNQQAVSYHNQRVTIKFMYLNFTEILDLSLDTKISDIVNQLKGFVHKNDGLNESEAMLKLVYRGKLLPESSKLGAHVKSNDLIQIFKVMRPVV